MLIDDETDVLEISAEFFGDQKDAMRFVCGTGFGMEAACMAATVHDFTRLLVTPAERNFDE